MGTVIAWATITAIQFAGCAVCYHAGKHAGLTLRGRHRR